MSAAQRRPDPRRQALTDLADAINELVRDRRHTEYLTERYKVERPGRKTTSRQRRRAVTTTLPSLLRALLDAAMPGAVADDTGSSGGGGFESRPAVDLGAVHTLQTITAEANAWRRTLGLPPNPLIDADGFPGKLLPSFVSHPHDDEQQLRRLVADAQRWVRLARVAAGFEQEPWTMNKACPQCSRRRTLTMSGDRALVKCSHCKTRWSADQFGILGAVITANEQHITLSADPQPCWWPLCTRRGNHDEHQDANGRVWRDSCDVPSER